MLKCRKYLVIMSTKKDQLFFLKNCDLIFLMVSFVKLSCLNCLKLELLVKRNFFFYLVEVK